MAWDDWLTITETLEDQLYLEIQARMLAEITDFEYLLDSSCKLSAAKLAKRRDHQKLHCKDWRSRNRNN